MRACTAQDSGIHVAIFRHICSGIGAYNGDLYFSDDDLCFGVSLRRAQHPNNERGGRPSTQTMKGGAIQEVGSTHGTRRDSPQADSEVEPFKAVLILVLSPQDST